MDSKFKSFIIGLLRRGSMRWKPAQEALNSSKEVYFITSTKGKKLRRVKFKCASCKKYYCRKEICLDHINPVVDPKKGFTTWDDYINRMYVPKSGYQTLCIGCHRYKTALEKNERKLNKPLTKKKK